ncbi:hypothetical protein EAH89_03545 [Roseomonas nepalensis]|uniref:Uncharacterized protein n=1 Tax=Muricoccus nepalensis TaxID=1854500 RepID=A0A502GEY0_9PROT|nr:hypothetical protein [Roseomonas nepalensis]TPG60455.1 hypothetical protein EAH89_03545 [Roseomonas nepalensis]
MNEPALGSAAPPPAWTSSIAVHHADDATADPRAALTRGLRAAHATGLALAEAAEGWILAAEADDLAEAFATLQRDAEEAVHRVEYILAGLRKGARGGTSWIGPAAAPAAAMAATLERVAQETLRLESLAHDLAEYQAARLLRMSAEEYQASARRLAALSSEEAP